MDSEILLGKRDGAQCGAVLENGILVEVHIEGPSEEPAYGDVYAGIVRRVQPGMNAAFVDIGAERTVFVPEARPAPHRLSAFQTLREGARVMVQIAREAPPGKGALG